MSALICSLDLITLNKKNLSFKSSNFFISLTLRMKIAFLLNKIIFLLLQIVAFINLLKRERMSEKQLFTKSELEEIAEDGGISIDDMTSFIDSLNEKGFLLKKGSNLYKFLPS